MNSKKWLILFCGMVIIFATLIAGFNIGADAFGVFGDVLTGWHSYDFTQNPKVAKIAYLDENYKNYNSYIIGSSGASAISPKTLEKYTGDRYYNLFVYGADTGETCDFAEYITGSYKVENILLNIGFMNIVNEPKPHTSVNEYMHYKTEKSSPFNFYFLYLFANPRYSLDKIKSMKKDTVKQQSFDVFSEASGCYDKSSRDAEPINSLYEYLAQYTEFDAYKPYMRTPKYIGKCLGEIRKIKQLCDKKNIKLTVLIPPEYYPDIAAYSREDITYFFTELAKITPFWDFSSSTVSFDARYFYDITHYRNTLGDMMLAVIYNDSIVYTPENFGFYATKENISQAVNNYFRDIENNSEEYIRNVTFISLCTNDKTEEWYLELESVLGKLKNEKYESVLQSNLSAYVENGTELPETPVVFIVNPEDSEKDKINSVLAEYGFKPEMSVLVSSYSDGKYNEKSPAEEERYINNFKNDFIKSSADLNPTVFLYPKNSYTRLGDIILKSEGIKITLVNEVQGIVKQNVLKGLPQTLLSVEVCEPGDLR